MEGHPATPACTCYEEPITEGERCAYEWIANFCCRGCSYPRQDCRGTPPPGERKTEKTPGLAKGTTATFVRLGEREPVCGTCHDTGWVEAPRHVNACPDCTKSKPHDGEHDYPDQP